MERHTSAMVAFSSRGASHGTHPLTTACSSAATDHSPIVALQAAAVPLEEKAGNATPLKGRISLHSAPHVGDRATSDTNAAGVSTHACAVRTLTLEPLVCSGKPGNAEVSETEENNTT